MNILLCIKQVPGSNNAEVDPVTGVIKRSGVESKMNPYDLYALEMAFSLCEKYGGEVSVITMGPSQAKEVLLEAIYMGASRGCLITDRRFAGADVLSTSYALSQGIAKFGKFDLILCGKQTTDGDTAQVGPELSEFLNISHVANVFEIIDITSKEITVKSNQDNRIVIQCMELPCLVCADADINTPRLPSYKRKKDLKDIDNRITVFTLDDMDDRNEANYGLNGSPTQVERIFPPEKNNVKEIHDGQPDELAEKLFHVLSSKKFI